MHILNFCLDAIFRKSSTQQPTPEIPLILRTFNSELYFTVHDDKPAILLS